MEFMTLWQNFSYFFFGLMEYLIIGKGYRDIVRHLRKPDEGFFLVFFFFFFFCFLLKKASHFSSI